MTIPSTSARRIFHACTDQARTEADIKSSEMCSVHNPWRKLSKLWICIGKSKCGNLIDRRLNLCEKFVKKCIKHPNYQHWFCQNTEDTHNLNTMNNSTKIKAKFTPVDTRSDRYQNSPLPYLTEILNKQWARRNKWMCTVWSNNVNCWL